MKLKLIIFCLFTGWLLGCQSVQTVPEATPVTPAQTVTAMSAAAAAESPDCADGITPVSPLNHRRAAHTATLLPDNTVLLTGGFQNDEQGLISAERFDPGSKTFSPTSKLSVPRQSHSATLLPNGLVLIAGGFNGEYLNSAELYDPETGIFIPTGTMTEGRSGHTAVLLDNGTVLLAGGTGKGWSFLASAEIYTPETGTFTSTGSMSVPRESHTATRLSNGQVLITGGHEGRRQNITIYDTAELYTPASGTFAATGVMNDRRHKHDATRLADGRVLISGGADERDAGGVYNHSELYDPASGAFLESGKMSFGRYKHTLTSLLLGDGTVLLIGGASALDRYHPGRDEFSILGLGNIPTRFFATATQLRDGQILFAGGYDDSIYASPQAWLITACPPA